LKNTSEIEVPKEVIKLTTKVAEKLNTFGIDEFVNQELASPSVYLLKNNGKLLRPALVFLCAQYVGVRNPSEYVGLGASIELLHTSSLIHDDIIDKDLIRRGKETVHLRYGIENAILAGDALISRAIQEASPYGTQVVDQISKVAMRMCAGEILDYKYQNADMIPSINEYLKIAELKSSALIAVASSIVAFHKSDKNAKRLYEFGMNLGTAFQIRDDIIDFVSARGKKKERVPRINIIRCIKENSKKDTNAAVDIAISLNRKRVLKAVTLLGANGKSSLLKEYAKKVAIKDNASGILGI
jgi:geranylgeranyl pyrophosphate synthase